ncbi:hypothetical protein HRQ91_04605 [Treponema parvum]|uniref:DUF4859 domain-containing protein n=1 Tax=Treponema parvum TaxID=138851 RepID=A0A975F3P9_9SPIR|nr:calycin-like domain-containing protein [Treponema parvum]QTQ13795.1 hypothetical protein HRQ91_04605 [Treponema parvum]
MKKNMRYFFKGGAAAISAALILLSVSCSQSADELKDHDISELYGYTYHGTITASGGNTLIPLLILYNDKRADWNMSINGMNVVPFYYYTVKNSKSNYTMYWFGGSDLAAAESHDKSKAAMTVQLGINSLDEVVILLTGDGLTGIEAMQNTRVPMYKQTAIPKNTNAPSIAFDPSIQDVTIEIPSDAAAADWGGSASYTGTFDYLIGPGGNTARGHGSCGAGIEPKITFASDGTHTVKLGMHRFAYTPMMTIEGYDIPGVRVSEKDGVYYLKRDPAGVPANMGGVSKTLNDLTVCGKLEGGKLTLRVEFKPGAMPLPIIEIFTSN